MTTTTGYTYDLQGRLHTVTENGVVTQTYGYDANGNRTSLATPSGTVTGTYNAQDELLTYGTNTYSYTPNGYLQQVTDTATGETTKYTYDDFGNLTHVDLPNGQTIDYLIDGENRRVGEKINGVLTEGFLYSGQLQPVAMLDGSGNVVERFVYGTGVNVPEYMMKDGVTYRLITDQVGSVRLVVNAATGEIAQRLDYDACGKVLLDTNPGFQPFGFSGGLYETSTGFVRLGTRDYDAGKERWNSDDPTLFRGGDANLYRYCYDNPIDFMDIGGNDAVIGCIKLGFGNYYYCFAVPNINPDAPNYMNFNTCESFESGFYKIFNTGLEETYGTFFISEFEFNFYLNYWNNHNNTDMTRGDDTGENDNYWRDES